MGWNFSLEHIGGVIPFNSGLPMVENISFIEYYNTVSEY